jgi:glutathione S-transferase
MPSLTLVIGNKTYSSWSLRPWFLLKHLGLAFEEIVIPLYEGGTPDAIRRYSAAGKVPVLIDGSTTVWESLAICEYLAERRPDAWPRDAHARAIARSVASEMHAGFASLRAELPMNVRERRSGVEPSSAARADIARVIEIWGTCRQAASGSGPWLFGDFSVADAMYAPVATRFHTYGVALPEHAARYVTTVLTDPAMEEWVAAARKESQRIPGAERGEPVS